MDIAKNRKDLLSVFTGICRHEWTHVPHPTKRGPGRGSPGGRRELAAVCRVDRLQKAAKIFGRSVPFWHKQPVRVVKAMLRKVG